MKSSCGRLFDDRVVANDTCSCVYVRASYTAKKQRGVAAWRAVYRVCTCSELCQYSVGRRGATAVALFLPRDATQSVVLLSYVVCLSVCP